MPKVKFLQDTVHPDYGDVKKGEVLRVPRLYLEEYEEAGIGEEAEDDNKLSRPEPKDASHKVLYGTRRSARTISVGREES